MAPLYTSSVMIDCVMLGQCKLRVAASFRDLFKCKGNFFADFLFFAGANFRVGGLLALDGFGVQIPSTRPVPQVVSVPE
jgi:hypothetical protein